MPTVTISGNNYPSYVDLATANIYMTARVGAGPDAWNASSDVNLKGRMLVSAKLYLDEQTWQGLKTGGSAQADEWPRLGVTDKYAQPVDSATVPAQMVNAQVELAAILLAKPTVDEAINSGSNVKTISAARGVDIEFFRPTDVGPGSTKLPVIVMRLVGQFLSTATVPTVNEAFNTQSGDFDECVTSSFDDCASYKRNGPLG